MAKILVVDDSMITRKHLQKLLSENGHDVNCASEGNEALGVLNNGGYDLVVLDQLMPGMEGLDVLKNMRESDIGCPVIMLTADTQQTTRKSLLDHGACAVISKPPQAEELLGLISTNTSN